jgi:hypothetical protein
MNRYQLLPMQIEGHATIKFPQLTERKRSIFLIPSASLNLTSVPKIGGLRAHDVAILWPISAFRVIACIRQAAGWGWSFMSWCRGKRARPAVEDNSGGRSSGAVLGWVA